MEQPPQHPDPAPAPPPPPPSRLVLTPLYGARSDDPCAYLLRVGAATLLLDCGWDDRFDVALLRPLLDVLPQVDAVLLSHPDTRHCGALPYLVGRARLRAPIYAAGPVARLGPMFMYDHHSSQFAVSEFDVFGPEDIDAAFDAVTTLKHHQRVDVRLKGARLSFEALPAGHTPGGSVWVVRAGGEAVVYGADCNHTRDRLLNAGRLADAPARPALLIAGAPRAGARSVPRAARERALEEALRDAFRRGGSALLPVDSAGRMLEVLLALDRLWARDKLPYGLALLSCVASSTLHAARGLLEWLSDELQREFNATCVNPLTCSGVQLCHSVGDVLRLPPGPKAVLATGPDLDHGMARQLLLAWGSDARNSVVMTHAPRPGTLAHALLQAGPARPPGGVLQLALTVGRRVRLEGDELAAFEAARAAREAEEEAAALLRGGGGADGGADGADGGEAAAAAALLLPMRESSGAISRLKRSATGGVEQVLPGAPPPGAAASVLSLDDDDAAAAAAAALSGGADAFFGDGAAGAAGGAAGGVADPDVLVDGFKPPAAALYVMFPDEQQLVAQEWDEYGAVIDTAHLSRQEEGVDAGGVVADDDEPDFEDGPTKVVTEVQQLALAASVVFVDGFAGVSDGRSLRTIAAGLAPRALIVVGGDDAATAEMAAAAARELPARQTRIFAPAAGEDVRLTLAPSYRVAVSHALLQGLSRHSLPPYEVAWLDGLLALPPPPPPQAPSSDAAAAAAAKSGGKGGKAAVAAAAAAAAAAEAPGTPGQEREDDQRLFVLQPPLPLAAAAAGDEPGATGGGGASTTTTITAAKSIEPMDVDDATVAAAAAAAALADEAAAAALAEEAAAAAAVGDHGGIFIGDVKLSEVKQALAAAGIPAEFRGGGRLVVGAGGSGSGGGGGALVVRRAGGVDGELVLEGPACGDYFRVRDVVYGLYNVC